MITFFSILLVLIAINAILMIFSLTNVNSKASNIDKNSINEAISKTYRANFKSSEYKEIV